MLFSKIQQDQCLHTLEFQWSETVIPKHTENLYKEEQPVKQWQGHGHPRLTDSHGEQNIGGLVLSHRTSTLAQIVERVHRNVSEHTVKHSLLFMWLCNWRKLMSTAESVSNWHVRNKSSAWSNGRRWADEPFPFTLYGCPGMWVTNLENRQHQDALWKGSKPVEPIG